MNKRYRKYDMNKIEEIMNEKRNIGEKFYEEHIKGMNPFMTRKELNAKKREFIFLDLLINEMNELEEIFHS